MSKINEDSCEILKNDKGNGDENVENENENENENDPHYDPIITLPEIEIPTMEEEEIVMVDLRARVYRYDSQENPPEWKERGTGNIKMLHHKLKNTVRVVMRRDKTLKLCANHFITPQMDLKPSASCEKAWVYSVKADYIDESVKSHLLAIKFANVENAQKWKDTWDEAKKIVSLGSPANNDVVEDEKKTIAADALKLNDTFDEEKKNNSTVKEENEENNVSEEKNNEEVTDKLTTLSIKESDERKSS